MTAPTRAPSIDAIRRLVAAPRERVDPRARILSNVDGPLSPALASGWTALLDVAMLAASVGVCRAAERTPDGVAMRPEPGC